MFLALLGVWLLVKDIDAPRADNLSSLPFIIGQVTVPFLFFIVGVVLIGLSYRTPRTN